MHLFITSIALVISSTSCTTSTKSSLLGATIGSVITTGLAMSSGSLSREQKIGLITTGTAIGAAAGYLDFESKRVGVDLDSKLGSSFNQPEPLPPVVRRMIVPDRVEGNKLIKSHEVFIIEKSSSWGGKHE